MNDQRRESAVLDSHVHFWDPRGGISYPWLRDVPALDAPFTPDDFALFRPADTSVISVEAGRADEHAAAEIEWVRDTARRHPWLVGAVAHVRLEDPAGHRPRQRALRRLAGRGNVVVKLSGLATELPVSTPRAEVVRLLREALELFGAERCLYGSDWPVMTRQPPNIKGLKCSA
ncbi:putative TIM-barrel fold metal-dependent hydrolase [Catenulispora sp. GP43]|uniref:amidohydrolase family protein n=1 Tax=Catenulispora sp. GP43 TaxID=3156263 RepID=UPI0035186E3A